LFQDTIRDKDSVETESLRGYYITDIPNGVDSFYVKLEVDEEFEDADYYINPIYYDEENEPAGDNLNKRKMAVIYENSNPGNNNINIPTEYSLLQNYPNPFNPTTTISYDIPNDGNVKIKIFDITGREIQTLVNEMKLAGEYRIIFDGSNLASGVYFYKIETGSFVQNKRMLLIK